MTKTITKTQAERVLAEVAKWIGTKGYGTPVCPEGREVTHLFDHTDDGTFCVKVTFGPAPTGKDAAYQGLGPMLDFEGGSTGAPSIILEGGPYGWAYECSWVVQEALDAAKIPVFVEPYAGWALSMYRNDTR